MKKIGGLLSRFKKLKAPERDVIQAVISTVREVVGVEIDEASIKISNESILYISSKSAIKSAIFENKLDIISRINNILNKDQIREIR